MSPVDWGQKLFFFLSEVYFSFTDCLGSICPVCPGRQPWNRPRPFMFHWSILVCLLYVELCQSLGRQTVVLNHQSYLLFKSPFCNLRRVHTVRNYAPLTFNTCFDPPNAQLFHSIVAGWSISWKHAQEPNIPSWWTVDIQLRCGKIDGVNFNTRHLKALLWLSR